MQKFLVVWDFNGVLNRFTATEWPILAEVVNHGGENIVVSQSHPGMIEQFLAKAGAVKWVAKTYGFTPDKIQWTGDSAGWKAEVVQDHIKEFGPFKDILMIGDSEADMRAGNKVGATTLLFSPEMLQFETSADRVLHSFSEVLSLLPK